MKRGFTLIELSIVLVVIGLIVGGVVAGKHLIRAGELNSITEDVERFQSAILLFQNKYRALPGDMVNAIQFWGADVSCPNTPTNTVPKKETCNGNGDGKITPSNSDTSNYSEPHEQFRAWQQLANAGLIKGSFTGVTDSVVPVMDFTFGLNMPMSKLGQAGYVLSHSYNQVVDTLAAFKPTNHHILYLSGERTTGQHGEPVLVPTEAMAIDLKMDDGKPGTGNVRGLKTYGCTTTTDPATSVYVSTETDRRCDARFLMNF